MKHPILTLLMSLLAFSQYAQETMEQRVPLDAYLEGGTFFEERLYLQAKESSERYLTETPEMYRPEDRRRMAELMVAQSAIYKELDDGEKLLQAFVNKYGPEAIAEKAMLELADYYFNNKMYVEAIGYYEMVNADMLPPQRMAEVKYKQAYAYYVRGDKENAKMQFLEIKDSPSKYYEETQYYLGILAFEDEDFNEALSAFKKANRKGKYGEVMPYYLSQIHFALGEYQEAARVGEEALDSGQEIDYGNSVVHLVAKSYFEMGDYAEALPYFDQYSRNAKKLRAQDLYQVAFTRYKTGDYDGAIKDFEELKSSQQSKLSQNAVYNLGDSYLKKGDKFSARNAFYAASKMDYDPVIKKDAHFLYAKLSYDLGFDRESITALRGIPDQDPNYGEAQRMISSIFLNTKDYDKAIEQMEQIPNKNATIKEAYQKVTFYKGVQYYNDRLYDESRSMFLRSLQETPHAMTKAQTLFYLGDISHQEGDYDASITELNLFLDEAKGYHGLPDETSTEMAHYIQGYNYLKKEDYANSATFFENSVRGIINQWREITNNDIRVRILPDAILRSGDSYFMLKKYPKALTFYDTSIKYKYAGYDYAQYQKARINGQQGNVAQQIAALKNLTTEMPNSTYADDALLLLGNTYFRERNYPLAERAALKLVNDYKQTSNLINQGYLLLGLVNYNQNDKAASLQYYEQVFANNPSPEQQRVALKAIEEIYIDQNDPNGFISFQERVLGRTISDEDKESLVYRSAEMQYEASNIPQAIAGYTQYLDQYPNGRYALQARYNRGEAYLSTDQLTPALGDYDFVVSKGNSSYYERALTKAAAISYNHSQDFAKSYGYYVALARVATDENKVFDAQMGALRSAFKTGDKAGVYASADAVLGNTQATSAQKSTAHYYKAKTALQNEDYDTALTHFRESSKADNAQGAESRYQIARIYYVQRDLGIARELCMTHLKRSKNYEFWVGRGMILFADIAFEQGDLFNARAAMETLIENYDDSKDPGIIQKARDRLAKIEERESEDSRIVPE